MVLAPHHPPEEPIQRGPLSRRLGRAHPSTFILLVEQRIARDPRTGRPPTAEDRLAFGGQLIRIMAESVLP
jgi:hypothetical protein